MIHWILRTYPRTVCCREEGTGTEMWDRDVGQRCGGKATAAGGVLCRNVGLISGFEI